MDFDVAIIGSGPSGIQASIHASRAKAKVVLLGKIDNSALVGTKIENFFGNGGVRDGISMLKDGLSQAEKFGVSIIAENVVSAGRKDSLFFLKTETDKEITAKSVIIATGISRKKLNVPGEKEFFGKGVSYCASCDCNFYKGKTVAIVGDETEAAVSAELMTKYASKVYWISKETKASETVTKKAISAGAEKIPSEIKSIEGKEKVGKIVLSDGKEISVDGVFIELGAKSAADLAMDLDVMPEMDDSIKTDSNSETEIKGVFACGDITGKPWQLAKAVGEGCVAGTNAAKHARGEQRCQ